jgi:glycerol-3-phosphate dehydrogenase
VKRDIATLAEREFEVLVVGGGIFGICAAWDAAQRGLSVALIEQEDFAHATSANCFKIAHGGIRYIQHGDFYRVRESSRERSALLRVAPHLVSPVPIVVPTYGRGLRGKAFLQAGMSLYDLVTFDRNRYMSDPVQHIPPTRALSRQQCTSLFPGIDTDGLTGGMLFYDGHMYNPPRLALSFLKSAIEHGAVAANYMKATKLVQTGNRVLGVMAEDSLSGHQCMIRSKVVVNTTGPWTETMLGSEKVVNLVDKLHFSRDVALVVKRKIGEKYALAVQGRTKDPDALFSRGNRHILVVPWRTYALVGVWHKVHQGRPEEIPVSEEEVQGFLDEVNSAYDFGDPLRLSDVSFVNAGLTLFGENPPDTNNLRFGKRSLIIDHKARHGIDGLITVVGIRYTTARGVGRRGIDLVLKKLGRETRASTTAMTRVAGGNLESFGDFKRQVTEQRPHNLPADVLENLLRNHGSEYREVLKHVDESPELADRIGESTVIKAEVAHAVRDEMAQKLGDVVFRRTEMGTGEHPGEPALLTCANLMAAQLGWDRHRTERELDQVRAAFPEFSIPVVGANS